MPATAAEPDPKNINNHNLCSGSSAPVAEMT